MHGELVIVLHQDATRSWHDIEESIAALSDRCPERRAGTRAITVVVGPEGGISEAEVDAFVGAGAECCVLGTNILCARPRPGPWPWRCCPARWDADA